MDGWVLSKMSSDETTPPAYAHGRRTFSHAKKSEQSARRSSRGEGKSFVSLRTGSLTGESRAIRLVVRQIERSRLLLSSTIDPSLCP